MTQEQADMRREQLAKVIVTKQDERIRELEEAVRIFAASVRDHYPHKEWGHGNEVLRRHMGTSNPIVIGAIVGGK